MAKRKNLNQISFNEQSKKITDQTANEILKKVDYLKASERSVLEGLSPNEIVYKVINDLLALQKDSNYQGIVEEYNGLKDKKNVIENKVNDIKSQLATSLGENIDIMRFPLKGSLSLRLRYCIGCGLYNETSPKYENLTIGDLVKFCIENKDWENYIKTFHGLGEGAVEKIKKLFEQYNIKI